MGPGEKKYSHGSHKWRKENCLPHWQARQGIFEYLLKAKKLQNAFINSGMETKTTFVWS
jgi:hypothetical protein